LLLLLLVALMLLDSLLALALAPSALSVVMHLQLLLFCSAAAVHALLDWLLTGSAEPGNGAAQRMAQLQHSCSLNSWPVNHPPPAAAAGAAAGCCIVNSSL
jgi:hypothetical protein